MTVSVPALAQECPPGAWFCEEVAPPPPPAASRPDQEQPDVEVAEQPEAPPPPPAVRAGRRSRPVIVVPHRRGRTAAPPPVVVYQPAPNGAPPQVVIVAPGAAPPQPARVAVRAVPPAPPPATPRRWHRRWGLNLRLEGASFGGQEGAAHDAGMGGMGMSLRYRPVPAFAFDAGIDVLTGTDFNGFKRTEMPMSLSGMIFVNPRSRVQFYFMGGAHISHAEVESDSESPLLGSEDEDTGRSAEYSYFGGHGGIGLEFRISRLIALNVDMLGFIRKRTDDGLKPEFIEAETGRTANSSGGGLFRGGLTFWW